MTYWLLHGDCRQVMSTWPNACVDSIVTDPPAGIGFMGKDWDNYGARDGFILMLRAAFVEALRVLKPGGHALVWAIPRTSHWTAMALELAGFEVRDRIAHLFGTGFPKSLNLGDGRGTALKPACEDWWLCRRPLEGTVAANVQRYGTGALNIDECRIGYEDGGTAASNPRLRFERGLKVKSGAGLWGGGTEQPINGSNAQGRWPANLVLDEDVAALLDAQSGHLHARGNQTAKVQEYKSSPVGMLTGMQRFEQGDPGDSGGASRFFYVAKPSRRERDWGCDALPARSAGEATGGRAEGSAGLNSPRAGAGRTSGAKNHHPTVKPAALMQYLVKLITPPGGVVLDPFCGSGSTGIAAIVEGFKFIGIDQETEYLTISEARLRAMVNP